MTLNNREQPSQHTHHSHSHHSKSASGNTATANHHHHSRLLYFLTDPSQAMLSLSRLPLNQPLAQQQQRQPFLFPTPTLLNNAASFIIPPVAQRFVPVATATTNKAARTNSSKNKAKSINTTLPTILPTPPAPIAVAAVDDCCNQCCPVIGAAGTNLKREAGCESPVAMTTTTSIVPVEAISSPFPSSSIDTNNRKRSSTEDNENAASKKQRNEEQEVENAPNTEEEAREEAEETTQCKWSSCSANFQTIEDLTPHLFKTHLNNSRKKTPQSNTCFWESCSAGNNTTTLASTQDLLNHLTREHLKSTLLHACRWLNCTERFEAFDSLTIHLSKVHVGSGKSEYICQWVSCERNGKIFTQRQKIMRHIQTHTGAKPYQCLTCQKRFSEANIMTQHIRTHTGTKKK